MSPQREELLVAAPSTFHRNGLDIRKRSPGKILTQKSLKNKGIPKKSWITWNPLKSQPPLTPHLQSSGGDKSIHSSPVPDPLFMAQHLLWKTSPCVHCQNLWIPRDFPCLMSLGSGKRGQERGRHRPSLLRVFPALGCSSFVGILLPASEIKGKRENKSAEPLVGISLWRHLNCSFAFPCANYPLLDFSI